MEPLISICIPAYNGARWLRNCIQSALTCTLPCEIIVVDDCSTDQTLAIANELSIIHPRIVVYKNEQNKGLVGNWNRCLELAKGTWIKFLFQDDILHRDTIEKMLAVSDESTMLIAARRNFVFDQNCSEGARRYYTEEVTTLDKIARGEILISANRIVELAAANPSINFIGEPSTVMFRRSLIEELGLFDTDLKQICDLEFWIRVASRYGLLYVPDAVVDFGIHEESASAKNAGGRKFSSTYLDPLRIVDMQLTDERYTSFREKLSPAAKKRMQVWLGLRAYEARINAVDFATQKELEALFIQRPHLRRISGTLKYRFLFQFLKWRRRKSA